MDELIKKWKNLLDSHQQAKRYYEKECDSISNNKDLSRDSQISLFKTASNLERQNLLISQTIKNFIEDLKSLQS